MEPNVKTSHRIQGTFLNPTSDRKIEILHDHLLVTNQVDGTIDYFGPAVEAPQPKEVLDELWRLTEDSFILPGFVDTHIHAPQYINAGNALDKPLKEWLEAYTFAAEARIDADPRGLGSKVYSRLVKRLIGSGTTAASVFGTLSVEANVVLAEAFIDSGIRGHIGKVNMDQNGIPTYIETTEASLRDTESFISILATKLEAVPVPYNGLVEACITPRFVPTCTPKLLDGLSALAEKHQLRIQSHMSESIGQVEWSKSLSDGVEDIHALDHHKLLTPRSLMAHCTHSTAAHLSLLSERQTSISHCPLSNLYFSPEKSFPLRSALTRTVKVGLGSDISGGYDPSIESSMRMAVAVARQRAHAPEGVEKGESAVEWEEALWVATRGGAEAMGLSTGIFERGRPFDAQLIELGNPRSRVEWFDGFGEQGSVEATTPFKTKVEKWFHLGSEVDRKAVWVQGRNVLQ
ncbi:BZ3500_MvSof-1268-A1-R1_Chr10-3g03074 [Microbotryum saponariae]|uniref:BZ3500_MvSof-1268-A1-R1_Chr10-3g03074 protein n=1 Tax=Microbotryum saponariae TaxID=289078 RepID=A0A2X0KRE5_9BASI|nr:BZ3501_MvSof-1269-A2-R1_Chr10-2g02652 [Microbotryum saponariae]SDA02101.1 BZ3500_MvSof-1268-A1-R1_Chr10-3g03074 [Microbotryum saponariae]